MSSKSLTRFGFLALLFTMPLYRGFFGFFVILLFCVTLFDVIKGKRSFTCQLREIHWLLPIMFFYYVIAGLATGEPFSAIEKRLPLLFVPLLFCANADIVTGPSFKRKLLLSFVVGNLFAIAICTGRALYRSLSIIDGLVVFNANVVKEANLDFFSSPVMGGNYFFSDEFSYFINQPTYFGLYLVFAQVLIFELAKDSQKKSHLILSILLYLLFSGVLFLLSSKAAIFCSIVLTFYFFFRLRTAALTKVLILAFLIIAACALLFLNPRLSIFLGDINSTFEPIDPQTKYGHHLRIFTWDAAISVIKKNWLFGVGEGNKELALNDAYNAKGYKFPAVFGFNSHNQYLDFLLGGGILWFSVCVIGMFQLVIKSVRHHTSILTACLLILIANLFFENLLSRHAGIVFFSVFVSLLSPMSSKQPRHNIEPSKDS